MFIKRLKEKLQLKNKTGTSLGVLPPFQKKGWEKYLSNTGMKGSYTTHTKLIFEVNLSLVKDRYSHKSC